MCNVEFVMTSVKCRCQISGGVGWGGGGGEVKGLHFFKPLKSLIIKFLEIASIKRKAR